MSAHPAPWWKHKLVDFRMLEGLERFLRPADCGTPRNRWRATRYRRALWRRYSAFGYVLCWWCRCPVRRSRFTIDHLRPLCLGGPDDLSNLVPSCRGCNQRRGREQGRTFLELNVQWMIAELRLVA